MLTLYRLLCSLSAYLLVIKSILNCLSPLMFLNNVVTQSFKLLMLLNIFKSPCTKLIEYYRYPLQVEAVQGV